MRNIVTASVLLLVSSILIAGAIAQVARVQERVEAPSASNVVDRGRYLATIGVCSACHTPPLVTQASESSVGISASDTDRETRANPDWFSYLDYSRSFSGGVPFILRFGENSHGVVYSRNITPDDETGIGKWTIAEIADVLRTGRRNDGTVLFMFPPHSFFPNLSDEDATAIATYLKGLPAVSNKINERVLPPGFNPPLSSVAGSARAPTGRTMARAVYLMDALVGCRECHSFHDKDKKLHAFEGGDRVDPFNGIFRLGPDLPLRQDEKGLATFPYPGYAVMLGGNLTRFGLGGDRAHISAGQIVNAIRGGISVEPDDSGRPRPLSQIMMWKYYAHMNDDDAFSIAEYLKTLQYVPHKVDAHLKLFGSDWEAAFEYVFGQKPSEADKRAFGKSN